MRRQVVAAFPGEEWAERLMEEVEAAAGGVDLEYRRLLFKSHGSTLRVSQKTCRAINESQDSYGQRGEHGEEIMGNTLQEEQEQEGGCEDRMQRSEGGGEGGARQVHGKHPGGISHPGLL